MKKFKLSREEQEIEDNIEKCVPVDAKTFNKIVRAIKAYKKDAVLSIRLNSGDLNAIKRKAEKLGVKYQSFIAEILHRAAQS